MSKIDVLMPAKNAGSTVASAIHSILNQTFCDLRLIIVDDGSTDNTLAFAQSIASQDDRVVITTSPGRGIVDALNHGLSLSTAPYVARMDSDDISVETRLQRQFDYMESHPQTAAIGCKFVMFGTYTGSPPLVLSPENCRRALCLFNPMCHPAVVMRRSALDKLDHFYSAEFPHAEDYELFARLASVGDLCNLDECLLLLRTHPGSVSMQNYLIQKRSAVHISRRFIAANYGVDVRSTASVVAVMARNAARLGLKAAIPSARAIKNTMTVGTA
jgi:glycosyltransferase involved in cell wall biosynthesis